MILFSKAISSIHTLNLLSEDERKYYWRYINEFSTFISSLGLPNSNHLVHNLEEVRNSLFNLPIENSSGVLVNFIGHGNEHGIGDNCSFFINWRELLSTFQQVNIHDNIILNTSLMCKGNGVFELSTSSPKPYHAAFGTNTNTGVGSSYSTTVILNRCIQKDDIVAAIVDQNNRIKENNSEYDTVCQRIEAIGETLDPYVITQYSYIIA